MKIAHPEYLALIGLFLVMVLVIWLFHRARKRLVLDYISAMNLPKLAEERLTPLNGLRGVLWFLVFILATISLMGPMMGERTREVKSKGTDLLIALDVSNSMLAQDVQPSRLEKAKLEIRNFLTQLKGDRVGLIVFENDAFLQCPLTTDYSAINLYLDAITTGYLPNPGTDLSAPVLLSADAFKRTLSIGDKEEGTERSRLLIVISDGEDHEGTMEDAVTFAKENRITVYSVGVGTAAGGPIPVKDRFGKVKDFRRDRDGNVVTTQLQETGLADLASKTGGEYFRISARQSDFYKLTDVVSQLNRTDTQSDEILDMDNKFQFPLGAALGLLLIDLFLIPVTDRRKVVAR